MALAITTALYLLSCGLGLSAQRLRVRWGAIHHVAYAALCLCALVTTVTAFRVALLPLLAVLAAFPRARPRTAAHRLLAAGAGAAIVCAWLS
ncbi:MAG: hypothetical protein K1X88_03205 [Nannocystaceae bacterium]|nr:hypothetical protein [Nannocystaceae bacterium]